MSKTIVMIHGADCGGWCFDSFRKVFEDRGFVCHAPALIGHGAGRAALAKTGVAACRTQMASFVSGLPEKPVLLGHSMACYRSAACRGRAGPQSRSREPGPPIPISI